MEKRKALYMLVFCISYGLLFIEVLKGLPHGPLFFVFMFFPLWFLGLIESFEEKEIKRRTLNVLIVFAFLPMFLSIFTAIIFPMYYHLFAEKMVLSSELSINIGLMFSCFRAALEPKDIQNKLMALFVGFSFYAIFSVFIFPRYFNIPMETLSILWPIFIFFWLTTPIAIVIFAVHLERYHLRNNELALNIPGFFWASTFNTLLSREPITLENDIIFNWLMMSAAFFIVAFSFSIFVVAAIYYYKYQKTIHDAILTAGAFSLFIGFFTALGGDYQIIVTSIITLLSLLARDFLDKMETKIFGSK